ncbi:hypothetical protein Slin_0299 [Spirosoma linguale DSM 74]|uniref:Uncharacterized protein n=1 Tax=Spirosoma linguale (strain ATCC 33905 / DSM 74 / LMG 10896 / Claus 1) TaxID=504472 RepID=D2QDD3_SPILD|nr:hypothetical protein Slin_0299 [Spirosoma linguale DSM 74]
MSGTAGYVLLSLAWLVQLAQPKSYHTPVFAAVHEHSIVGENLFISAKPSYTKSVRFGIYAFTVAASDSGRTRTAQVKAYRGALLLTNFTIPVDGAVVGADVADLDNNRFPELYVYTMTDGSGSFGQVYAWQFLPERKADILVPAWRMQPVDGYMGHDSLWTERNTLYRKFPVYRPGDANVSPSGGYQLTRYQLKPAGNGFALIASP